MEWVCLGLSGKIYEFCWGFDYNRDLQCVKGFDCGFGIICTHQGFSHQDSIRPTIAGSGRIFWSENPTFTDAYDAFWDLRD